MSMTKSALTLVRDHFASQRFNPELTFGPDSSDGWAIISDIASSRPDLFTEIGGTFDSFEFGEFISDLEAALTWGGSFPAGKRWVPPAPSALTSRPAGWGDVSPVHPDQRNDAVAKYVKQPMWQSNRTDWIILSAFLFDALARTYDTTMSNPGGLPNWSYTFAGGNLTKMLLWRLGSGVTGFVLRWLLVPGIVAIVAYRTGSFDIGQGWLWLLGLWAAYAVVRVATFPVRFVRNRKRSRAVQSMMENLGRLERVYISVNGGVFNPTVMKLDLQALNNEGVPVPAPVFAMLDRAIQRDSAVFTR